MEWCNNIELELQYREGSRKIKKVSKQIRMGSSIDEQIIKSNLNSMAHGMDEISQMIHSNILFGLNSLKNTDIRMLTESQREIVKLRMKYRPTEVAKRLKKPVDQVVHAWNDAIKKLYKIEKQRYSNIPIGLTIQQELIYELMTQNKNKEEISKHLGLSKQIIRVQINNIKKKMENDG